MVGLVSWGYGIITCAWSIIWLFNFTTKNFDPSKCTFIGQALCVLWSIIWCLVSWQRALILQSARVLINRYMCFGLSFDHLISRQGTLILRSARVLVKRYMWFGQSFDRLISWQGTLILQSARVLLPWVKGCTNMLIIASL